MNFVHRSKFRHLLGVYHQGVGEIGIIYDVMNNNLYSALRGNGAYKNNKKLAPLKETKLTLNESIICFSHRWLMENDYVDEKVMQRLVHDVRGVRSTVQPRWTSPVWRKVLDAYITMSLEQGYCGGQVIVEEVGGARHRHRRERDRCLGKKLRRHSTSDIHEKLCKIFDRSHQKSK